MTTNLMDMLKKALELEGSDLFIVPGSPAVVKVNGSLIQVSEQRLLPPDIEQIINETYQIADGRSRKLL